MTERGGIFEVAQDEAEWNEHLHPRDAEGKFVAGAGSSSAPLKWKNPVGRIANVYKKPDGKWMYQLKTGEWKPLEASQVEAVEAHAYSAQPAGMEKAVKHAETFEKVSGPISNEVKIKLLKKEGKLPKQAQQMLEILEETGTQTPEQLQANMGTKITSVQTMVTLWNFYAGKLEKEGYIELTSPVIDAVKKNKELVSELYTEKKMGVAQIAQHLGLDPKDQATRNAIRNQLTKMDVYKSKAEPVAEALPTQKTNTSESIKKYREAAEHAANALGYYGLDSSKTSEAWNAYAKKVGVDANKLGFVNAWLGSSHNTGAQYWKAVAAEYYGKDIAQEPKIQAPAIAKAAAEKIREVALAQKEYTAAWVRKHGAKEVYRGLKGEVAKKIKAQLAAGKTEIELSANSLSSWSESQLKAKSFGYMGVVLKQKVDPEHVWACYQPMNFNFSGYLGEKEYVMGTPGKTFKIKAEDISIV